MRHYLLLFLFCTGLAQSYAQESSNYWTQVQEPVLLGEKRIQAREYASWSLNVETLATTLAEAPLENTLEAKTNPLFLDIPMPDGSLQQFEVVASPIMAPGLAKRFPMLKTYSGKGVQNKSAYIRLDLTQKGFHAIILNGEDTWFVDPFFFVDSPYYISYYKRDFQTDKTFECLTEEATNHLEMDESKMGPNPVGPELRTYRLAVATTGEYTQYHGGTVEGGLAAVVTTMNRVNAVYERDVSVRMILVDSNHLVIYTNPSSDPYTGGNFERRNQNQGVMDSEIGQNFYDIGHVFDQGGGGVASLNTVCQNGEKGLGYTANNPPEFDAFDIDYVAHELGHQFGGNHTFNSCGGQGGQAYEPGSGTTIMAYAGICGSTDIQANSDDHFHVANFDEIARFTLLFGGNSCAEKIPTGNTAPVVDAGPSGYVIPKSTPFELVASATDAEGDSLTYCWEQYDLGPQTDPDDPEGNSPMFRSFSPRNDSVRTFPRLSAIINNTSSLGEVLADYSRNMRFRCLVRDNHGFGGGADWDQMTMSVTADAGPFRVTSQNNGATWTSGAYETVTWNVANTDQAPVNAQNVNVFLSVDGGLTYPYTIAENVPNVGSAAVLVPEGLVVNDNCRVKVKGADNVFFDLNNQNFTIEAPTVADFSFAASPTTQVVCGESTASYTLNFSSLLGFNETINLVAPDDIPGLSYTIEPASFMPPAQVQVTVSGTENVMTGNYTISLMANGETSSKVIDITLDVFESAPGAITLTEPSDGAVNVSSFPEFTWELLPEATEYELEIASDPSFNTIIFTQTGIEGTTFILEEQLVDSTDYFWRVRGANDVCGGGDDSAIYGFTTEVLRCDIFKATDLPVPYSNFPFVSSKVVIDQDLSVRDVNIRNVQGTKLPFENLEFRLRGPENTTITLLPEFCAQGNDYDISFDDESPLGNIPCPYNNGLTYRPSMALSAFDGLSAEATWRLFVYNGDEPGELSNWELEICYGANSTSTKDVLNTLSDLSIFPNPGTGLYQVQLDMKEKQQTYFQVVNAVGQVVKRFNWGVLSTGKHQFEVDLTPFPSGMYFYQLISNQQELLNSGKIIKQN